jgi:hypothetical protein
VNPLQLLETLWRHRIAVLPAALLTILGLVYVTILTPPTYEVTVSYVLVPPPKAPSSDDVARDPSLANVRAENPFVRFPSSAIVVDLVARRTEAADNRRKLLSAGADERFEVLPSNRYGFSSPIVDVIAVGSSEEAAMSTARLVSASVEEQLRLLHEEQQVDEPYMYQPLLVDFPERPRVRVSNRLRAVVAVVAAGGILMIGVASMAEAFAVRSSRRRKAAPVHPAPLDLSPDRDMDDRAPDTPAALMSRGE